VKLKEISKKEEIKIIKVFLKRGWGYHLSSKGLKVLS